MMTAVERARTALAIAAAARWALPDVAGVEGVIAADLAHAELNACRDALRIARVTEILETK